MSFISHFNLLIWCTFKTIPLYHLLCSPFSVLLGTFLFPNINDLLDMLFYIKYHFIMRALYDIYSPVLLLQSWSHMSPHSIHALLPFRYHKVVGSFSTLKAFCQISSNSKSLASVPLVNGVFILKQLSSSSDFHGLFPPHIYFPKHKWQ